ncbi:helix-turn-helix domain-containing protein [Micromonospora sp. NPDC048871]|uniref:nSTAND1 domain-containing NTPase n=1 Tax=Micromonospora sp. NPDC048871 TaxID=3364259 RepID=UPI0037194FCC
MPDERWTADEHFDPRTIRTRAEFGQALTTLRMGAGLTVRQVASRAGANGAHSTIGEWFAGRGLPSTSSRGLLIRVLSACGVGAAEIEGWLWAWQRLRRSPGPRPVGEAPYPGLASFQPEDAAWFHGRGALTEQLIHRVTELADEGGGLQFVVGASGSGKSSLVRAGLVAALRAEEPDSSAWSVTLTEPGYQPTVTLAQQFASTRPAHRPVGRRLVVVDQFEEVFAARVSEDERQRFIQMIADLAARPGGAVVVVTLRADFYGHALRYLPLIPALLSGQLTVGPMTEDELRVAIVEPARKARVEVEDGFVELLLRTVLPRGATAAPEAGVLPLLSHALYATWQHGQGARLTIAGYLAVGGIAGAVAASAEQIYQGLSTEQRDLTRRLFLTLVQVNPDAADTRRRVGMAELREGFPRRHSAELEYVLGRYVEKRLLTADTDTVEISHEALITAWPSLREWLKADRDGLVIGQQLTAAAAAWRRENRDPGLLYRGNRLAAAQGWVAGRHHDLSPAAVEFLRASARHTRRRTRRLHQLVGVLTALSLLTFGLAGYAFQQRTAANAQRQEAVEERNQALSRLTAGRADRLRDSDVPLAMQLSLAAYRMAPTVEARSSLLDAYVTPAATRLPGFRTGAQAVAHSSNGRLLAAGGLDQSLRLWRTDDPDSPAVAVGEPLRGPAGPVYSVAFSPDSSYLAAGSADGAVWIWDIRDPAKPVRLDPLRGATSTVYSVAFSPDGRLIAAGSADQSIRVWDISAPGEVTPRPAGHGHTGPVQSVAFGRDGTLLASGGADSTVRLWDVAAPGRPKPLGPALTGHTGVVTTVGFSPDGTTLASGSRDHSVRLWEVSDPRRTRPVREPLTGPTSWVNSVAFSPDGQQVAGAGSDKAITVWARDDGRVLLRMPHPDTVTSVSFGVDGRTVASAALDGVVRVWRPPGPLLSGSPAAVFNLAFLGDGGELLATAGRDETVRFWQVADPRQPGQVGVPLVSPAGLAPFAATAALGPDGTTLAVGTRAGTVLLWSVADPARPVRLGAPLTGPTDLLQAVTFSPDGRLLAAAGDDGQVYLWDVRDPQRPTALATVAGTGAIIFALSFSVDSSTLAVGSTDTFVRLIDLTEPTRPVSLDTALGGFSSYTYGVAFSPDGRTLAVGSADKTIRLWDVTDLTRPQPLGPALTGPIGGIYWVTFDADSSRLAAAATDGSVWLWDVRDTRRPAVEVTLTRSVGAAYTVAFAPNGNTLAAADSHGGIRLWELDPERVAGWICATAGAGITPDEWHQYVPGAPFTPPCQ